MKNKKEKEREAKRSKKKEAKINYLENYLMSCWNAKALGLKTKKAMKLAINSLLGF